MNVVNNVIKTSTVQLVTEMVPVTKHKTVIVETVQKQFVLTEKEALLLRDLMGSNSPHVVFDNLKTGRNLGQWNKNDFEDTYLAIFNAFNNNVNALSKNS